METPERRAQAHLVLARRRDRRPVENQARCRDARGTGSRIDPRRSRAWRPPAASPRRSPKAASRSGIAPDEVKAVLAGEIEKVLAPVAKPLEMTAKPFVILVAGVNGSGKTTTIGKLAAKFRAEGKTRDAGGRRHLPRRRHRSAQDLGRAHRRQRDGARAGRRRGGPGVRRARRRQDARRRHRAGRHRRPPAEPRRADGRTGKDGARHAQGRAGRAARGAAGARRHRRAERAQSGRDLRQDRGRHRIGDDQARRHRARRHPGGDRRPLRPAGAFHRRRRGRRGSRPFTARDFARAIVGLES